MAGKQKDCNVNNLVTLYLAIIVHRALLKCCYTHCCSVATHTAVVLLHSAVVLLHSDVVLLHTAVVLHYLCLTRCKVASITRA